ARRRARRTAGHAQLAAHRDGAVAVRQRSAVDAPWRRGSGMVGGSSRGVRRFRNLTQASGNVTALRAIDLDTFFRPRSVAVIGASDTPNKPTSAMTRKIRAWSEQFGADFHPVNP